MAGATFPVEVVLHQPEIPNNTGNIGRTCVAVGARLRLIHPLGFSLDEKACRRAGLDYWPRLDLAEHGSWDEYIHATPGRGRWLLTTRASRSVFDVEIRAGDHLVFGSETSGLPRGVLEAMPERCVSLPMVGSERSLNLATVVCAVVYEAVRQQVERGELKVDRAGRIAD